VVILTVSEAERDLLDAVAAGALGYLLKSTPPDELRNSLWKAAHGEPVFSPSLASLVLTEFRRLKKSDQQLFISPKTVENHTRNILDKLHLSRKNELMRYALEHGIE
jgi:DNA-binding NarL/FixJ family response regulator